MNKNLVLVSGAVVFRPTRGKSKWFIVKQTDNESWEIPKVMVRKGESSVRAALRMIGEKGSMSTKVLEEVGRAGGATTINGKTFPQRHLYYLMLLISASKEPIGFSNHLWLEYAKAVRKLTSKRERAMLKQARKAYRTWKKEEKNKNI
jgi:ADP-ribose pyrophosphatase YjhB (NUDIX family)